MKINILQLITGLGMGGAEKVVLDLATYTSKNDFNTFVVSMSEKEELLDSFIHNNINTTILRKSNSLIDFFHILWSINKFIKMHNIQIIHAHMTHPIIVASILKLFHPSLKIVYTSHNLIIGSRLRELIVFILKPFRDIDIVFSKDILKFFYKKNHRVIPNGIKVESSPLDIKQNEKFTFLAIGRLEIEKNHKFLIEIAKNLQNKYDFEIHIVGEGSLKDELNDLINKYNLKNIKLLGLKKDIPTLLHQSHCLLMPSLWEGLPIVILEAGANSLPIISTPVGSIPSLLNNENSYLSKLDDFEESMISVLEDYSSAKQKSITLLEDIKKTYAIESVISEHEKIYKLLKGVKIPS